MNEYTWCVFVPLWGRRLSESGRERDQAWEPLRRARLLLLVSTAQDATKQNQLSDPWQNQADLSHFNISYLWLSVNSLRFGSAVLLLLLDPNLIRIVRVSDLSNKAPRQSWMIDFFFFAVGFFTPRWEDSRECEDMNNALEGWCSQMKGHSWLILFFPLSFLFWNGKRKKKSFSLCSSLTVLRLDRKTSFLNKMVENKTFTSQ